MGVSTFTFKLQLDSYDYYQTSINAVWLKKVVKKLMSNRIIYGRGFFTSILDVSF